MFMEQKSFSGVHHDFQIMILNHMHTSCHKAIVVITGRVHCFHGCIYINNDFMIMKMLIEPS